MKRARHWLGILVFALAVPLGLLVAPVWTTSASANLTGDGFNYTVDGSGDVTIYYCSPSCSGSLNIPASIGGDPVTTIANGAFAVGHLSSLTLPSSITSIGVNAFYDNNFTSVIIPASVTLISDDAFADNALTSVTIPSSVTSIGASAFYENALASVTIPSSVTSIGDDAFGDNALTSVTFVGSAPTFGANVFTSNTGGDANYYAGTDGWGSLASGTLDPFTLNELALSSPAGGFTFLPGTPNGAAITITGCDGNCPATLAIPSSIGPDSVTSIGIEAFETANLNFVTLPSSLTTIGDFAFASNSLTSMIIPSSVTSIGVAAFQVNSLTSVTIPSSVTSLGNEAFYSNLLTSVTIPSSLTTIDAGVFEQNDLTSVSIPSSVTSIDPYAFETNQLTSLTIPDSVVAIYQGAFEGSGLTALTIPSSVNFIGNVTFADDALTSVTFLGNAPTFGAGDVFLNDSGGPAYYYTNTSGWSPSPPDVYPYTLTPVTPLSVDAITLDMSSAPNYDATGSNNSWSVSVPQDSATTIQSAHYTLDHVDLNAAGINTASTYPVTFVSGPGVSNGDPYGTLAYSGSGNDWILTPGGTQSFETAGTWVLETPLTDLAGQTTTVQLTLIVTPLPSAATGTATNVTAVGATLNGTVTNPGTDTVNGLEFCYQIIPFASGDCAGSTFSATSAGGGAYYTNVTLVPNLTYYVEFEGTDANLSDPLYGGVETFRTPVPPIILHTLTVQSPLTLTSTTATLGTPLTLTVSGGSGTGALSFTVSDPGTAGCSLAGDVLSASSAGTCAVSVAKAGDAKYLQYSSPPTTVTVIATSTPPTSPTPPSPVKPRVQGVAHVGRTVTLKIIGSGFAGRPRVTSNEPGTVVTVLHDTGTVLVVRVSVPAGSVQGLHEITIHLLDGKQEVVSYRVE